MDWTSRIVGDDTYDSIQLNSTGTHRLQGLTTRYRAI